MKMNVDIADTELHDTHYGKPVSGQTQRLCCLSQRRLQWWQEPLASYCKCMKHVKQAHYSKLYLYKVKLVDA